MLRNGKSQINKSKYLQRLSRLAFVACGFAICVSLVLAYKSKSGVSRLISSAELINTTGRQRTLSQRMTNLAGIEISGLQSSSEQSSTSKNLDTIGICAKEIQIGYDRVQSVLSSFRSDPTLLQARACLTRTEEHRNGQLDAVRRFLAEFNANEPEKSLAVYSEIVRHSELFLPEMEQATAALQLNRQQEVRSVQKSLWIYFGTIGAISLGLFGLFVWPSVRLAKQENDKRLTELERLKQLATISERTTNAVVFTDPHSRILWVNEGFTRITGYTREEVIGKVSEHFLQCSETSAETVERMCSAIKNQGCFNDAILNQAKDGRKYWLHIDFQPTYSEEGIHTGFVAIESDVTETKRYKEELEESNRQLKNDLQARILAEEKLREVNTYLDVYRKIVDHHAIVAETDTSGTMVAVNDAFCRISGYSREELIGQNHRILNSGLHPKTMWTEMYKTVANGGFWHAEICNRSKNGKLYWVDTTIAPLFNDLGKVRGYFAIRADITSFKKAQDKAESASRNFMRSRQEFMQLIYAASHDLQEPLRTQLNYLDLLSEELQTAEHDEWLHFVDRASYAVRRMQALIADLLEYASLGMQTKREPIDMQSLITEIQEDLSQAVNKKHAVIRVSKLPWFKGNRSELKQLFQNLLTNAMKYVALDTIPNIEISAKREGRFVVFSIVDNGIGIAEEHFRKIFLMFQRLHSREQYEGTGIGLALCKKIVENYDGQIGVCSTVGTGSNFWMKFHDINILGDFE